MSFLFYKKFPTFFKIKINTFVENLLAFQLEIINNSNNVMEKLSVFEKKYYFPLILIFIHNQLVKNRIQRTSFGSFKRLERQVHNERNVEKKCIKPVSYNMKYKC